MPPARSKAPYTSASVRIGNAPSALRPLARGTKTPARSAFGNGLLPHRGIPPAAEGRSQIWNSRIGTSSFLLGVADTGSSAHYLDIARVCFSEVPLIVGVRHRAFAKVADDLDIFVVMEAKSRVGSDLIVIENNEIPDRLVGGVAVRPHGEVMFCFEPASIKAADIFE